MEIVQGIAVVIAGCFAAYLATLVKDLKNYVIAKIGETNYDLAMELARGLYVLIEDKFEGVVGKGFVKKNYMEQKLLETFPNLTQNELDSINKAVWEEFNMKYAAAIEVEDLSEELVK